MDVSTLEPIALATLLPGAQPVHGTASETWKGSILTENGQTVAYVKIFSRSQQLISEAVCALLGRALGLNIPKPFLINVEKTILPESQHWKVGQESCLGFGSEEEKHQVFSRIVKRDASEAGKLLREWSEWKRTVWFDEWIANGDRHPGNLLYDSGKKKFWLIDHSHALTGWRWKPDDLSVSVKRPNQLIDQFIPILTLSEKREWKRAAQDEVQIYSGIQFDLLVERARMHEYADNEHINAVICFLRDRVHEVLTLACARLGMPRLVQ